MKKYPCYTPVGPKLKSQWTAWRELFWRYFKFQIWTSRRRTRIQIATFSLARPFDSVYCWPGAWNRAHMMKSLRLADRPPKVEPIESSFRSRPDNTPSTCYCTELQSHFKRWGEHLKHFLPSDVNEAFHWMRQFQFWTTEMCGVRSHQERSVAARTEQSEFENWDWRIRDWMRSRFQTVDKAAILSQQALTSQWNYQRQSILIYSLFIVDLSFFLISPLNVRFIWSKRSLISTLVRWNIAPLDQCVVTRE